MRHEKQTAKLTTRLTGMHHAEALRLAETGRTERHHPVPDAILADQRAFEARLAFALIEAFPEQLQPQGFPWGIESVRAETSGIDIFPAPDASEQVLGALVPYHDRAYGGIRGASGVRVNTTSDGWWILRDSKTAASVRVAASATTGLRRGGNDISPRTRHFITAPRLTTEERRDLQHPHHLARSSPDGWLEHRDVLGSRLLRRPKLIQLLAEEHGFVNIYSHAGKDVVLEWCCGYSSDAISFACQKAGLISTLAGELLPGTMINRRSEYSTTMQVGHARLYLRHNTWACPRESGTGTASESLRY
jgi:hypothetical protein